MELWRFTFYGDGRAYVVANTVLDAFAAIRSDVIESGAEWQLDRVESAERIAADCVVQKEPK